VPPSPLPVRHAVGRIGVAVSAERKSFPKMSGALV